MISELTFFSLAFAHRPPGNRINYWNGLSGIGRCTRDQCTTFNPSRSAVTALDEAVHEMTTGTSLKGRI